MYGSSQDIVSQGSLCGKATYKFLKVEFILFYEN